MSESIITLWINSETNSLLPSWNSFGTATIPSIKQGDSAKVEIHWIKSDQSGNFMSEVAMSPTSTLKLAVGSISGVPTEGYFTYNYQGDTVQIPYDADVTSFPPTNPAGYVEKNANTLINSLPSIIAAGGVVVSIVNQRTLRIVFNNFGVRALSSCDATTLRPSTNVSVTRINTGGATTKEVQHLRPKVLPIAYADSFSSSPSPVISITNIDSITKRISITPQPKFGTFTISNGTLTTSVLSINSSASDVLSALTSANINSSTRLYSVAKSGDYSWDIYRTSGTAETLTVTDSGMIGFESKFGVIDFNTIELEDYLGGAEKANATIEVEYSDGTIKQTLYQGTVSIVNDLIESSVYSPIPFPELTAGIGEAPMDSVLYGRKDGVWSAVIGDGNNIPDYNNGITYTVGNQVYFQGKLYRMIIAVGGAGYDPVSSPSYWESLSGSNPDLTNYLTKDGGSLNSGAQLDFDNSFGVSSIGPMGAGFYEVLGTKNVAIYNDRVEVADGVGNPTIVTTNGITFPDATVQTTAAVTSDLTNYLTKDGGGLNTGGGLQFTGSDFVSKVNINGDGCVAHNLGGGGIASLKYNVIEITGGGPTPDVTRILSTGITFPDGTTQTTSAVTPDLTGYAPLASPALTGVPTAPTPLASDNSTTIATTAYVTNAVASSTTSPSTQKVTKTVRNATAALIPKRSVVYINGANGTHTTISLAQANAESTSYRTFGITESDIAINGDGVVVIIGEVLNVNTGSFNDGDQLYLSPTIAGGITNVKPSAPNHMVYVGVVTRANNNNGKIEVNIANGFELHELHDVAINGKLDKDLVSYEQSTNLWKNKSAATLGIAELSGATFTGKVNTTPTSTTAALNLGSQQAAPSSTVAGDLWIGASINYKSWDGVTKAVANTNTTNSFLQPQVIAPPSSSTTTALRITNTGTGESLRIEDETNPDATPFVVGADGRVGIHGVPATNTSHKLAIYNGNIVFSQGYGLAFGDGTSQTTAANVFTSITNTFTTNQVISGSTGSGIPMLRITQDGLGDVLRVQDITSDTSSFVINKDGLVGINGEPHGGTYYPLTVNDGDIRLSGSGGQGYTSGITFVDGSRLTSAAGVGATTFFEMTDVDWDNGQFTPDTNGSFPVVRVVNPVTGQKVIDFVPSYYWNGNVSMPPHISTSSNDTGDPVTSVYITLTVTFIRPILSLHTGFIDVMLSPSANYHTWSNSPNPYYNQGGAYNYGKYLTIRPSPFSPVNTDWVYSSDEGWYATISFKDGNGNSLNSIETFNDYQSVLGGVGGSYRVYTEDSTNPYYDRPITERGFQNAFTLFLLSQNAIPEPTATARDLFLSLNESTQRWSLTPRSSYFTEKVVTTATTTTAPLQLGVSPVNPTQTFAGDVWLAGNNIFFKDSTNAQRALVNQNTQNTFTSNQIIAGSNSTLPMLRITQTGLGHSLVVEDGTNPDTTSFIVNNAGNVGIGVDPATWSPTGSTRKLDVIGNVFVTGQHTVTGNISITHSGSVAALQIAQTGTGHALLVEDTASPDATSFVVNGDGNIGVGVHQSTFTATAKFGVYNSSALPSVIISQGGTGSALQVTNTGTGNSIVVEDSTNPDATSFIVDSGGNVGIGVASGYTPVGKLDVNGTITATTPSITTNSTLVATTAFVKTAIHPHIITLYDGQYAPSNTPWQVIYRLDFTYEQTINLPNDTYTSVVGAQYVYVQIGIGRLNFTPSNGITVMSAGGKYFTNQQYSVVTAIKTGPNEWLIAGDLSVS